MNIFDFFRRDKDGPSINEMREFGLQAFGDARTEAEVDRAEKNLALLYQDVSRRDRPELGPWVEPGQSEPELLKGVSRQDRDLLAKLLREDPERAIEFENALVESYRERASELLDRETAAVLREAEGIRRKETELER